MTPLQNRRVHELLSASLNLAGLLLAAQNEEAAIQAVMRVCVELSGADGAVFLPLNEWGATMPALKFGQIQAFFDDESLTRMKAPDVRQACRICGKGQAGAECKWFDEGFADSNIFCQRLRCDGREVGIISYFSSTPLLPDEDLRLFLAESVRLADLALSQLHAHHREVEAIRRAVSPQLYEACIANRDTRPEELLRVLEYKAILDERSRLAREIHDGLAQTLAFLKLEAGHMQSHLVKGDLKKVADMLNACHQTLSDAYLDARQAIDDLRQVPDALLSDWLQTAAADFRTLTDIRVDIANLDLEYAFPPHVKVQVVRILQEALTNIRKHADACAVTISAFEREGQAVIEVQDNGRGFDPGLAKPVSQYGLRSMRERAESIDAELQISSLPEGGTTVLLRVPIQAKDIHG